MFADEMNKTSYFLLYTSVSVRTAHCHLIRSVDNSSTTHRTICRHFPCLCMAGSFFQLDFSNLGNDISSFFNPYPIPFSDILPLNFLLIVKSSSRNGAPCDKNRL